jgi:hypothetical protein
VYPNPKHQNKRNNNLAPPESPGSGGSYVGRFSSFFINKDQNMLILIFGVFSKNKF